MGFCNDHPHVKGDRFKALESERGKRRRDQLITEVEGKLQQKVSSQQLFAIRWQVR